MSITLANQPTGSRAQIYKKRFKRNNKTKGETTANLLLAAPPRWTTRSAQKGDVVDPTPVVVGPFSGVFRGVGKASAIPKRASEPAPEVIVTANDPLKLVKSIKSRKKAIPKVQSFARSFLGRGRKTAKSEKEPDSQDDSQDQLDEEESPIDIEFHASSSFTGSRPGFVFQMGSQGLGYYTDTKAKRPSKKNRVAKDASSKNANGESKKTATQQSSRRRSRSQSPRSRSRSGSRGRGRRRSRSRSRGRGRRRRRSRSNSRRRGRRRRRSRSRSSSRGDGRRRSRSRSRSRSRQRSRRNRSRRHSDKRRRSHSRSRRSRSRSRGRKRNRKRQSRSASSGRRKKAKRSTSSERPSENPKAKDEASSTQAQAKQTASAGPDPSQFDLNANSIAERVSELEQSLCKVMAKEKSKSMATTWMMECFSDQLQVSHLMTGKSLMSGHKALQRKYEEAAASQSADLCDVKVFKRVFVQFGAGGYGSVSFSIDFKHYKGKAAQKRLSHTGSEFEICAVMSLRNKICFMAVAADEEGLGPEELIGMETVKKSCIWDKVVELVKNMSPTEADANNAEFHFNQYHKIKTI